MNAVQLAVGFALATAVMACDLPTVPSPPLPDVRRSPTPGTALSCAEVHLGGVVVEGAAGGIQGVADAMVNWRHFEGGAFRPTDEIRTDSQGRYNVCVPTPPSVCDSGGCRVKYEVRAHKIGYAAASTSVVVDYDAWWFNDFRVPDLQLVPEQEQKGGPFRTHPNQAR